MLVWLPLERESLLVASEASATDFKNEPLGKPSSALVLIKWPGTALCSFVAFAYAFFVVVRVLGR
jgi:hypothetical protein